MTTCIPLPQNDTLAFTGPPDWLGSSWPEQRDKLDDPRWTGALHQGFPAVGGTSEHSLFRALYSTVGADNFLYLSWWVKVDGSVDVDPDTGDHFYVGFRTSAGGTAMVIKIVPFNSAASDITNQPADPIGPTPGVGSIDVFTNTGAGGAWVGVPSQPTWINTNTRIWLTRSPVGYAVQMKVPLKPAAAAITNNDGPNLGADFRMWYSMRVELLAGPTFYSWQDGQDPTGGGLGAEQFPDPSTWEQYHLGTSGCASGVSLSYDDIGTTNSPEDRIRLNPNTNRFIARPKNATGHAITAQTIKARFRIANWGSMICDPTAPWDNIPVGASVTHTADYPTGTSVAPGQAPVPANPPTNPNPTSTLWFDWALSPTESQPFIDGTKDPDQCILVNLTGAGVTFTSDSACKNMTFDTSSLSVRAAHIDIRGLKQISSAPRDVYILVEKINMPTNTPAGYNEGQYLSTTINRIIAAEKSPDPNSLGKRLGAAQKLLAAANPEAFSATRLTAILAELRLQVSALKANDQGLSEKLVDQLLSLIGNWFTVVKQDKNAAYARLEVMLKAWVDWLQSRAAGDSTGQSAELLKVLADWLSAIKSDPASSEYLPKVSEALGQWLANLVDESGSIAKLLPIIESLSAWLNSDRLPDRMQPGLEALGQWLASLGGDKNMVGLKLAWLIQEVVDWSSPATDRLAILTGALEKAGVTARELDMVFPTCRFHVYHDTGLREARRDGRSVPILRAQIPFGYWLYHEDDLEGWTAILEGATRLAYNFYVIKVSNESATMVTTKVQAAQKGEERIPEPPIVVPKPGSKSCSDLLSGLLGKK